MGGKGFLLSEKFDLRRVLQIGKNILDKDDLRYLEQQLDADVPRINKKSPFKKKYNAAGSKKILTVLEDMKQTFEDNLKDAEDKEKDAKKSYDELKESKAQVEADEGYIADTEKALEEKKKEFKERKKLRMGEIAAISEAIGVLRSDDARDTFKSAIGFIDISPRSLTLLQTKSSYKVVSSSRKIMDKYTKSRRAAADAVREAGARTEDPRLTLLALKVLTKGKGLEDVISEIDKMIK